MRRFNLTLGDAEKQQLQHLQDTTLANTLKEKYKKELNIIFGYKNG